MGSWLAALSLLAFVTPASAQERGSLCELPMEALQRVSDRIRDLDAAADVGPLVAELDWLAAQQCIAADPRRPAPWDTSHATALRHWWESGGSASFRPAEDARTVVVPPDMRGVLTLPEDRDHRLAPLLCDLTDERCGRESFEWWQSLDASLRIAAEVAHRLRLQSTFLRGDPVPRCADKARQSPPELRYAVFRDCLEGERPSAYVSPIVRLRPLTRGWLVLRGRRGHYEFCDEVRAYDLATGAAWVAESCSSLFAGFETEGVPLDHAAVDAARQAHVRRGRVPIDLLRHAVFLILLAPEVEARQAITWRVPLPDEIAPPYSGSLTSRPAEPPWLWRTSAQTSLAWSLRVAGRTLAEGHLTWPYSSNPVETRAADRLDWAEREMVELCPPRRPPRWVFESSVDPIVSEIDATPQSLDRIGSELDAALFAAVREPCRRRR